MNLSRVVALAFVSGLTMSQGVLADDIPDAPSFAKKAANKIMDGFDGTNGTVLYRNQSDTSGNTQFNQLQYGVDIKFAVGLTPDGRLQIKARALSGDSFANDLSNTGVGNKSNFQGNVALRNIFIDYMVSDHVSAQVGALMPEPEGVVGVYNIDRDGWVDGGRLSYKGINSWMSNIDVTVGSFDNTSKLNAFDRSWNSPNLIQVHVRGDIGKLAKYMTEFTNFQNEQSLRGTLDLATSDILKYVDHVVLEEMIGSGTSAQKGYAVSLQKTLHQFSIVGTYSDKSADLATVDANHLILEDRYQQGKQITLTVSRPYLQGQIVPFFMIAKTVSNTALTTDQGLRVEAGTKIYFKRKEKLPVKPQLDQAAAMY